MVYLEKYLIFLVPIIIIIALILATWKKAPQDKAIVVTGLKRRVISGRGGIVIPFFEQCDRISLENMKVEVKTHESLDKNGVPIDTDGVAIIKVKSDTEGVLSAVEQFNTGREKETIEVIKETVQDVLEGKLREIVSKMSIEEIYKDREMFANEVEDVAKSDLQKMGLEIKTFTIRDIDDTKGYLTALGAKQIAEVKKNASIAEAEARREEMEKTAEAKKRGTEAQLKAETEIARATKEKELKIQSYKEEEKKAQAKADFAYEVEKNTVQKQVIEALKNAELFEEQRQTEIAKQQAIKKERELEANIKKVAEAEKYKEEQEADADRYKLIKQAEAEAESIKIKGLAEAEAIRLKGEATADAMKAEASAMKEKAEAYKMYGEAAIVQMLADKLPEVAKYISEPIGKTEKMIIIDNGGDGGASKITKNVTSIISEIPEVINSLTGIDMIDIVKNLKNNNVENSIDAKDNIDCKEEI
ncbi:MAG: SPFH domain-containing protein [Sarcina ventriculi]|uniref:Inner membrane protein yqiK n=1 Tax=Sarcina ventriculi TaxID=1267 RepID=A0ABM9UMK8_SARVE|nr:flotillin family protein [Sarcina ventriculi]MDO4403102.1 SPFH domain-containing protein [Clostridiaceae bacterium]MCI5636890.1 SPFH domain-containing protein [Sarcina ventriculi]MDD7373241.1 SPFH domain-containing protein [Sarcina ventriculi]MDY7063061.1 SPFH domain-containing protein [Sarcina ventriculi]CUN52730.1 Inner membrane protein yqiK [Sarcina ventriculi]